MEVLAIEKEHSPELSNIYEQGIATGIATFETTAPSWEV